MKISICKKYSFPPNLSNKFPPHLTSTRDSLEGKIISIVDRNFMNIIVNELLVVEYYSRKFFLNFLKEDLIDAI